MAPIPDYRLIDQATVERLRRFDAAALDAEIRRPGGAGCEPGGHLCERTNAPFDQPDRVDVLAHAA